MTNKIKKQEKIYVVGDHGPEHNSILSIHKTKKGALNAWDKLRKELLNDSKDALKNSDKFGKEMYSRIVKNLSCKKPEKIDNYPQETPYIIEMILEK